MGERSEYAAGSQYVLGLDVLPLGRVVNDAKVTDHHAIIPTRAEHHPVDKMYDDDRKIYDLVVRRFLAVFHPEAVIENTRVETTVADHVFRTRGKRILVPGWRGVYGERERGAKGIAPTTTRAASSSSRASIRASTRRSGRWARRRRRQSRRGDTPTARCSWRWRPPASWSTTRRPARR